MLLLQLVKNSMIVFILSSGRHRKRTNTTSTTIIRCLEIKRGRAEISNTGFNKPFQFSIHQKNKSINMFCNKPPFFSWSWKQLSTLLRLVSGIKSRFIWGSPSLLTYNLVLPPELRWFPTKAQIWGTSYCSMQIICHAQRSRIPTEPSWENNKKSVASSRVQ